MNTENLYRPYHFPNDGSLSGNGLTPQGLSKYVNYLAETDPETYNNAITHINSDPECTPNFDEAFLGNIARTIKNGHGRGMHIIYRGNHTVSLLNEDNTFLLLDSYNAYGAKDADHLPVLEFIRQRFPQAEIFTLHDKIQNDYHNCAFFSCQSAGAIERYLQHEGGTLGQFIGNLDTQKIHIPSQTKSQRTVKRSGKSGRGCRLGPMQVNL